MAWIEYHTALRNHWKIKRLSVLLGVEYVTALGAISCLWLWAAECVKDGCLTKFTDEEIQDASRFAHKMYTICTLKECELIDKKGRINDWKEYGLKLLESTRNRVRKHRELKRYGNVTVTPTNQPTNLPTNQPKEKEKWFVEIWEKYPKKIGRKQAHQHFVASVKTEENFKDIQIALKNYLESERVYKGFIQNGSTWFNNWQDWINFQEKICQKCKGEGKYTSTTGYEIICDCPKGKGKKGVV